MAAFFSRVVSPPIRGSITPALLDLYPEMPGSTDRCHLLWNSMLMQSVVMPGSQPRALCSRNSKGKVWGCALNENPGCRAGIPNPILAPGAPDHCPPQPRLQKELARLQGASRVLPRKPPCELSGSGKPELREGEEHTWSHTAPRLRAGKTALLLLGPQQAPRADRHTRRLIPDGCLGSNTSCALCQLQTPGKNLPSRCLFPYVYNGEDPVPPRLSEHTCKGCSDRHASELPPNRTPEEDTLVSVRCGRPPATPSCPATPSSQAEVDRTCPMHTTTA